MKLADTKAVRLMDLKTKNKCRKLSVYHYLSFVFYNAFVKVSSTIVGRQGHSYFHQRQYLQINDTFKDLTKTTVYQRDDQKTILLSLILLISTWLPEKKLGETTLTLFQCAF